MLVTRASHQASSLADALRARGAIPVLLPTIEIAPPVTYEDLDGFLKAVGAPVPGPWITRWGAAAFDWVVFTSANAVKALAARAAESHAKTPLLPASLADRLAGARVASIGPATSRALASFGVTPDLTAPTATAESLAEALVPFARGDDGLPRHFLLIQAEVPRPELRVRLSNAGARVTGVAAYRTVLPENAAEAVRSLFSSPQDWPAAATFTSSSSALNLAALLQHAGLSLPASVRRISIGPITTTTLVELGWPPDAQAATASVESLAEATMLVLNMNK